MKKLSLFLFLGIFFTVVSCDKSTRTEDLQESLEQEITLIKGDNNAIPITPGATTMDIQLPNGQVTTIDIPIEFQLNEDGTPIANRPATPRSWNGICHNVVTVYPFSNDSFTQSNVAEVTINYAGTDVSKPGVNQGITNGAGQNGIIGLDPGDLLKVSVETNTNASCNDILLIVGSWDCNGGKFDFMQMDFLGDVDGFNMGLLSLCHDKCGLNPFWTSLITSGGC